MTPQTLEPSNLQTQAMRSYYRFQSRIYDATRWSFLFGRRRILDKMQPLPAGSTMLEVGCGTGYNLRSLARRHPQAQLTGIDISADMIRIAGRKTTRFPHVRLLEKAYGSEGDIEPGSVDAILFSYSLTMINPQWPEILLRAQRDLRPGGRMYIVDFHSSRVGWFRRHMAHHHVRMEGHFDDFLESHFSTLEKTIMPAYGGLWHYFFYVGEKPAR